MATLKSLIQETVRAGAQSSVLNYGASVEFPITGTSWEKMSSYTAPANGIIAGKSYFPREVWIDQGNGRAFWFRQSDAESCCSFRFSIRKGETILAWWSAQGSATEPSVHAFFVPYA